MKFPFLFMAVLALVSVLFIAGCTQSAPQVTPGQDTIRVASGSLGTILVNANGRTLYYFAADIPASGTSSCSGSCTGLWPVFSVSTVTVSPPLAASDFSSFTRADGTTQTTYHGWPLYYFEEDANNGDVYGENVGGNWFVVKPDETVMIAQNSSTGLYLTDRMGNTLYYFTKDTAGASACTGGCSAKWPPFSVTMISAPSVLNTAAFSSVARTDGMNQTTYMGRPLYYFANDTKPGDMNGEGFNNLWYAAGINGTVAGSSPPLTMAMVMPTVTVASSLSMMTAGGGGY